MPFIQQIPHSFNHQDVLVLNPNQNGIYGLFKEGQWVYVGKGDIKQRLLAHLNGDNQLILRASPTHWVAELCNEPVTDAREKQLILELQPLCNQKIG
jgi:hypothetical protein